MLFTLDNKHWWNDFSIAETVSITVIEVLFSGLGV
jgi:hypothetical protein